WILGAGSVAAWSSTLSRPALVNAMLISLVGLLGLESYGTLHEIEAARNLSALARAVTGLRDSPLNPLPQPPTKEHTTLSGLQLGVPEPTVHRCWNADVPCTPYPVPNLRLRVANDSGKGFMTDGAWEPINWPNATSDFLEVWRSQNH